jgi:Putative prokaryotic signal transducing protein
MDEVPEIRLCEVSNELEAAMVVNLLREDEIPARSDANQAMNVFGGLPFEPGHTIFVPASMAHKAREILSHYPHFHNLRNVHEPGL